MTNERAILEQLFAGGGEMGALMRSLDWSQTRLGPVSGWAQSLKTAVSILLNSRYPMFIGWRRELVVLYNDAYRPILGGKHPQFLGKPLKLAVIEFDCKQRVLQWSPQAERIFGWEIGEVLGKRLIDSQFVYVKDEEAARYDVIEPLISGYEQSKVMHNRNYTKDGSVIYCEWYNSVLRNEAGELVSILSFALDITERQRTQEELQNSEAKFWNDILALNRLESQQVVLKKQWCDAAAVVQQAFSSVQNLADANQIALQSSFSKVQIWADPDWLVQVLVNLINNAIKFSPAETTIAVDVETQPQQVLFRVTACLLAVWKGCDVRA